MDETLDNRYDSDENIGPFFDAIVGESQLFDETLMDNEVSDPNISILHVCSQNTVSTNDSKHDTGDHNNAYLMYLILHISHQYICCSFHCICTQRRSDFF